MQTQTFQVQGMTCGHCERAVTQAIQQVDPAATVQIDRASGQGQVQSGSPRGQRGAGMAEDGYAVAA